METYLDYCTEIIQAYQLADAVPAPGAPIEQKVQTLIFDPFEGAPEEENPSWVGQAILDTKALLVALECGSPSSNEAIAEFFSEWFPVADSESPGWSEKNTSERLHFLMWIFCAGLDGFCEGLLFRGEEQTGFAGDGTESESPE